MKNESNISVHWSFWAICLIGILFNIMGCVNYLSQTNAEAVAQMPEAYRILIDSRPAWATGAFAIAVFGGAVGALLLLLRKSISTYLLVLALVGAIVAQIPLLTMTKMPTAMLYGGLSQILATLFLIWYSTYARQKGWLGRTDGGSRGDS